MHVLERPAPQPAASARYADHACGQVDLFLPPDGELHAPVILIHGGFWRARYDRVHLRPLAAALAATGRRVALPEYRRVGDTGGGWPGSLNDILSMLDTAPGWLGTAAEHVVLAGHSAGGHLAMLAAAETEPAKVVSLAGVLDVGSAHAACLSDGAVAAFLGTSSPAPDQLAVIDPLLRPLPSCPIAVVHGRGDADVPMGYSVSYAARDPRVDLTLLPDADHYDLIDPLAPAFATVESALRTGE